MHAVFTNLMAGLLFIHTVFGCCWHHAHSYGRCEHATARSFQPVKCCKHHPHQSESKQSEKPCGCKIECEGTCTYLVPEKIQIDGSHSVAPFDLVAVVPTRIDAQFALGMPWEDAGCPDALEPPLRLHLLHQILLI